MSRALEERLRRLAWADDARPVRGGRRGIEKEGLRVDDGGFISRRPHPEALGSALTHPYITTDYSEALLELITPPFAASERTLAFLDDLHRFVHAHLDGELIWCASMPCRVRGDDDVPIATYGTSNVGFMKHVYRRGLGHRYGRVMQTIAGVHFNYSAPDAFWPWWRETTGRSGGLRALRSRAYFGLIRNFQRLGWIVPYLFGASPAVCRSFLPEPPPGFVAHGAGTWYRPYATSLRMSDIGYKNKNQAGLRICYDDLESYVAGLTHAIETPEPAYEAIGVCVDGEWRQLNPNILQIENEYYSFIRPKQIARSGEKPTAALRRRGVRYVEVRALDVDPFHPLGVAPDTLRFLEAFVLLCLLEESPPMSALEQQEMAYNQQLVACCGRDPRLELRRLGAARRVRDWALEICDRAHAVAEQLDRGRAAPAYGPALARLRASAADPESLPSARVLAELRATGESFLEFSLRRSREHAGHFRARPLDARRRRRLETEARRSLERQRAVEAADRLTFEEYLRHYFAQTLDEAERLRA